jgi:N-acetylneuraminic acid mutarotase
MPTARHGLVAIAYNFSIFVIGGGTEPGYSMSGINEVSWFGSSTYDKY